jgi:hypothetical protein
MIQDNLAKKEQGKKGNFLENLLASTDGGHITCSDDVIITKKSSTRKPKVQKKETPKTTAHYWFAVASVLLAITILITVKADYLVAATIIPLLLWISIDAYKVSKPDAKGAKKQPDPCKRVLDDLTNPNSFRFILWVGWLALWFVLNFLS